MLVSLIFHTYIIVFANWMHIFGKTLCYGLGRATRNLHSKFGPISTNTDRVLQSYAVNLVKHACWNEIMHLYLAGPPIGRTQYSFVIVLAFTKSGVVGGFEVELRLQFFHKPVPEDNQRAFQCPAAGGQLYGRS